ncbi:MAG TPA: flagellar basal body P-ring formation chaperone FlgA [Methylomirabilota bacterium]|nr:flagellar basal body P-ring formation chaperone FlgA [Methylomirabilota bacterium]
MNQSCPRPQRVCVFLSVFLLLGYPGSPARAFAGEPSIHLRPQAAVDGSGVFLDQLVEMSFLSPTPKIRLAAAPAPGQTASFSRAQLLAILQNVAPELARVPWTGAETVRISRKMRTLDEAEIKLLLTAVLQADYVKDRGELELRLARPWTPVTVPDEAWELRVLDLPASGVTANFIVRFELRAGEQRLGPWQAVLQARLWREVPVARSPLRRGQSLASADVTLERRDALGLRDPLDAAMLQNPGLELADAVPAGSPLLNRSVRFRPVIQRGQIVDGIIQDGRLSITLKVEVLADALPGQTVRVRNTRSRREFFGRVHNEQTVLITL